MIIFLSPYFACNVYIYTYTHTHIYVCVCRALPGGSVVKNPPANAGDVVQSLGQEDPLEEMATHSSILAWRIPWTEEPGVLQSMGHKELDTTS